MSFFKKLLKSVNEKMLESFNENVLKNDRGGVSISDEQRCRNNIEQVIASEYVGYELRRNVPSAEMHATDNAVDYTYGLYNNGYPVLFINVIVNRNNYSLLRFRRAKEAAEANGVPHLNFFSHLPNEVSYISNRLYKTLNKINY